MATLKENDKLRKITHNNKYSVVLIIITTITDTQTSIVPDPVHISGSFGKTLEL